MLTNTPVTDHTGHAGSAAEVTATSAGGAAPSAGSSPLQLRMSYADPQVPVLSASGDLDLATTPQLAQLLWPRLKTTLSALVVDFSEVTFLGLAGLELLANAHTYAGQRGIAFGVVNSTRTVDRALAACGLDATLPCFASVVAAVEAQRHLLHRLAPTP